MSNNCCSHGTWSQCNKHLLQRLEVYEKTFMSNTDSNFNRIIFNCSRLLFSLLPHTYWSSFQKLTSKGLFTSLCSRLVSYSLCHVFLLRLQKYEQIKMGSTELWSISQANLGFRQGFQSIMSFSQIKHCQLSVRTKTTGRLRTSQLWIVTVYLQCTRFERSPVLNWSFF